MSGTGLGRRLTRLEEATVLPLPTAPICVQSPADVVALVEATVNDVRAGRLEPQAAAVIGALAGVALKAMAITDVAERLEALESVLEPERRRMLPTRR
jgi:hypothetical protein